MSEVGAQGGGAVLESPKLPARLSAQLLEASGYGVEQGLLHARIALLLGIEVGAVGGQEVRAERPWMPLQEALHVR